MQLESRPQDVDRRRLLTLLGVGSAAVLVGAGPAAALTFQALQVDMARVRREFAAGPQSIPLDRLLPDDADAAHLEAARESLRFRVRGIARVLLDRNQSTREQLVVAKHAMIKAQTATSEIVDRLLARAMTPAQARADALRAFSEYYEVIRAC